ncbi:MAG: FkbM family methyltransferase [Solirubrobacteraceae bacterium]|jgi:FkbM family methyltransferase
MARDAIRIVRAAGHSFLAAPISPTSVVVDLGVNEGEFALAMIESFGCSVVGIEPVPDLFAALPRLDRLAVDPFAVTATGDSVTLYLNRSRTAATIDARLSEAAAPSVQVEGITLAGLLDRHRLDRAPLVKIDIEGAELEVFENASIATLQRVDQFTVEFHDFLDPQLAEPVRRAKQRLRSAGFAEFALGLDNQDVLFVNRARIPFGPVQRAAAALTHKYPRGVRRQLDRHVRVLRGHR